jgi:hypothetical protein
MQLLTQRFLTQLLPQLSNSPHAAGSRPIVSRRLLSGAGTRRMSCALVSSETIVGRFAWQLEVDEVVQLAEKCGRNGWARNNCRGDGSFLSVDDYMAAVFEPVEFSRPLMTRNYVKQRVSA